MRKSVRRLFVGVCMLVGTATIAGAQGTWTEVSSPHFTVVSNAGDGRAREIAWQFEQVRAAIAAGWPWARVTLDRPVLVVAAKDESTMKSLMPQLRFEPGTTTTGVGETGPDRHYIVVRGDVRSDERVDTNPFYGAYWIYSAVVLTTGAEHELPLWYWTGLACVLGNVMVRPQEMRFGLPIPWLLRDVRGEARLRLSEMFAADSKSSYYTDDRTRQRFDAEAWAFMHYLLFEASVEQPDRVNKLTRLLLDGRPSVEAVKEIFGDVDALEIAYQKHVNKPLMQYSIAKIETKIDAKTFTARTLAPADAAVVRAGVHVAFKRPIEARALLAESRKIDASSPRAYEVEGQLLDREGKRADAQAAFEKAEELKSDNFYTYFRLAELTWPQKAGSPDTERRLRRAAALNAAHAPTQAMLAEALVASQHAADALEPAKRAVTLEPGNARPRLALARVQWALNNRAAAQGLARSALAASRTDEERQQVKQLIDFFDKAQ